MNSRDRVVGVEVHGGGTMRSAGEGKDLLRS